MGARARGATGDVGSASLHPLDVVLGWASLTSSGIPVAVVWQPWEPLSERALIDIPRSVPSHLVGPQLPARSRWPHL